MKKHEETVHAIEEKRKMYFKLHKKRLLDQISKKSNKQREDRQKGSNEYERAIAKLESMKAALENEVEALEKKANRKRK